MKNNNLMLNIHNFLEKPKGYKKSWYRIMICLFISVIFISIVLALSYTYGPVQSTPPTEPETFSINYSLYLIRAFSENTGYLNSATYISFAAIILMIFPFICWIAIWTIGINQTGKSKIFHLILWITTFIVILLTFVSVILLIRSCIISY